MSVPFSLPDMVNESAYGEAMETLRQASPITWQLDPGHAEELVRVLNDVLDDIGDEDDGLEAILDVWVSQLTALIEQRQAWDSQVQPGLVGLA